MENFVSVSPVAENLTFYLITPFMASTGTYIRLFLDKGPYLCVQWYSHAVLWLRETLSLNTFKDVACSCENCRGGGRGMDGCGL